VFSWQSELSDNIHKMFKQERKVVTFSIKYIDHKILDYKEQDSLIFPAHYQYGINYFQVKKPNMTVQKYKIKLNIKEKIPVSAVSLAPEQAIRRKSLYFKWIPINKLTKFILRDVDNLIGFSSKYFKKEGDYFYRRDIKKETIIRSGDECTIWLNHNAVQIVVPGIALKNGAIGSKIKVVNKTTNKILDVFVINSRNVEVKL